MFFICENELEDAVEIAASSTGDLRIVGACVEPFEPSTLFCPLATSEGNNFRTGCRINVGIEIFLGLDGQTETRIGEGDETG